MEKDILSIFVSSEIAVSLIKKLYRLAVVLLVVSSLYSILELFEWYLFLEKASVAIRKSPHYFYSYKFRPIVSIIIMALSIIGHILNYQGYGHILAGIKSSDEVQWNKGFKNFYTTYILLLISFALAIMSILYRLLR